MLLFGNTNICRKISMMCVWLNVLGYIHTLTCTKTEMFCIFEKIQMCVQISILNDTRSHRSVKMTKQIVFCILGHLFFLDKRTTQRVTFDSICEISLDSPELFNIHPPSLLSSSKALSWADKQTAAEVKKTVWKKLPGVLKHSSFSMSRHN